VTEERRVGHWLHRLCGGRGLAAYAAGELPEPARVRMEARLGRCAACRQEVAVYRAVSSGLRRLPPAHLTPEEAAAFWPAVAGRLGTPSPAVARPRQPGLREILWDHPRLGLASAATAALLLAALTLAQFGYWGSDVAGGLSGVEVLSVDVDEDASVMVFDLPDSRLKIIWVFEDRTS
jgi:anti-sigma factor RsiW